MSILFQVAKICASIFFFALSTNSFSQVIFSETFGEGEDLTSGTDDIGGISWSTACPTCLDAGDYFKIQSGKLVGQDTNGPATYTSAAIDISSCDFIEIEFDLSEEGTLEACGTGCNSVDFVRFEYNIDGAGWMNPEDAILCTGDCAGVMVIQSDDIDGGSRHYSTGCISGGSTLQIRISVQAWAASERWIIDNVNVNCAEGPELSAGEDQTICEGTAITLTADNPDGAMISWNAGVINAVSFIPPLGINTFVLSGELGECTGTDTVIITVVPAADVSISPAGPYTTGSGIQLMSATPAAGSWSSDCGPCLDPVTGEFDPAISGPGSWTICYTAGIVPCDDEECISILVTDGECGLIGSITKNDPTCYGFSDGSVTINMTGETGELIFVITNEVGTVLNIDNSNTANTLDEGWYYFAVSDDFPCVYIDSVFLDDPDQMSVDLNSYNPLCYGDFTGGANVENVYNATGDYDEISYFWSPNPNGINGKGEDSLFEANAGTYNLGITDENGCSFSIDFILENPDSLYFNQLGFDPAYCRIYDYQNGNGVVYASAAGGTPDYDYKWENLTTGESVFNTTWGGLNPGDYEISVSDENGCSLSKIITLDSLNPIADFTLSSANFTAEWEGTAPIEVHFENTSLNFANPNNPFADTVFFWGFGDGSTVLSTSYYDEFDISYTNSGEFDVCLKVINKNGCADSLCRTIIVYDPLVFIPVNIFTPNGDGKNDVFTFNEFAQSVDDFNCVILNRWGIQIKEMTSISDSWDGTLPNGDSASDGVYFYSYSGKSFNGTLIEGQGTVQILR